MSKLAQLRKIRKAQMDLLDAINNLEEYENMNVDRIRKKYREFNSELHVFIDLANKSKTSQ